MVRDSFRPNFILPRPRKTVSPLALDRLSQSTTSTHLIMHKKGEKNQHHISKNFAAFKTRQISIKGLEGTCNEACGGLQSPWQCVYNRELGRKEHGGRSPQAPLFAPVNQG